MEFDLAMQSVDVARLKQPAIHHLTEIQAHGVLLVLSEPELTVLQVSRNTLQALDRAPEAVLGCSLDDLLDPFQMDRLTEGLAKGNLELLNPSKIWIRKRGDDYGVFDAVFHRTADGFLVLELEPALTPEAIPFLSFYHLARASIGQLEHVSRLREFCQVIVQEVRHVTDFDRVMLYRFDDDGHGEVVAEDKIEEMESYMGLHFPESDIPRPARQMFLSNWIRVIPDAKATPVGLFPAQNPMTQRPTDLTQSILRSAHRCHRDYLNNMGVGASLTISLMKDGKLWGLIACHHRTAKPIPYDLRKACEFLGRVVFADISTREETADHEYQIKLAKVESTLVAQMSEAEHFIEGLTARDTTLLDLVDATGAAICWRGHWTCLGETPVQNELELLVQWLDRTQFSDDDGNKELFQTDSLARVYADGERFKAIASGLLAIPISKHSYVLWFRPEVLQTVNWGGNPHQAYSVEDKAGQMKLNPRKSFSLWKETVRLKSLPWKPVEICAVAALRKGVVNIVLRQAEELALLAYDLERSNGELKKFAYVASHDLQEPLNQVANFVQLLEMRYNDQLDQDAKDFIGFAVDGVSLMQTLIDDVLTYSKVDLQGIEWELTDVGESLERGVANVRAKLKETEAVLTFESMPMIVADGTQLMQLFQNLIGNAIKFRRPDAPLEIHVGAERRDEDWLFSVRDNGIGIDPEFSDRIFVIFQRLHTRDEYPGSGMGLAICKKIAECHRGKIWVESEPGQGSTFYFTIPLTGRELNGNGAGQGASQMLRNSLL